MTSPSWLWHCATIALAIIAAALLLWAMFSDRSRGRRRCPRCWYDMAGAPPGPDGTYTCPECGRVARRERHLYRPRRRWRAVIAAALLAATAVGIEAVPRIRADGWGAIVPLPILELAARLHPTAASDAYDAARRVALAAVLPPNARRTKPTRWTRALLAQEVSRRLADLERSPFYDPFEITWRSDVADPYLDISLIHSSWPENCAAWRILQQFAADADETRRRPRRPRAPRRRPRPRHPRRHHKRYPPAPRAQPHRLTPGPAPSSST